jgi:hypothetical protein
MLGAVFALIFVIGSILVTSLIYLAINPRSINIEGEGADLRYIGFALLLIILSAATIGAMLLLGKAHNVLG